MDVPPKDLICRPLAALKDNRAEAEEYAAFLSCGAAKDVANGAHSRAPAAHYRPGLYMMMDWVASRLSKAGAALWGFIIDLDEAEGLVELAVFMT